MKLLVVGGGSIGKRHAGNFQQLGVEVGVVDTRADRRKEVTEKLGITATYPDVDTALRDGYDAALVGVPTAFHDEVARKCLDRGLHILMEKPLSDRVNGQQALFADAAKAGRVFMVGYTYRFWPPLQMIKTLLESEVIGRVYFSEIIFSEYLPDWHPWEDYRSWFMSKKEQGGGALLDESHTVDLARWLFGEIESVFSFTGNISHLEMSADDHAMLMVEYAAGSRGIIQMDLFGRKHRRTLDIRGERGTIWWDYFKNSIEVFDADGKVSAVHTFSCDRNEMFMAEARHFLASLDGSVPPIVTGDDALRTLEVLDAARLSSDEKRMVRIPSR